MKFWLFFGFLLLINSTSSQLFDDATGALTHISDIFDSFSSALISKYKAVFPVVATYMQPAVDDTLDTLYGGSTTQAKNMVNQTRTRYNTFMRDAQIQLDQAIHRISNSLDAVKARTLALSSRMLHTAQRIQDSLKERECAEPEIFAFFDPFINQTVDCLTGAVTEFNHFDENADRVGTAVENVLKNAISAVETCMIKGTRIGYCARRASNALNNRLSEIRNYSEQIFSRTEVNNIENAFQEGKSCAQAVLEDQRSQLDNIECGRAASYAALKRQIDDDLKALESADTKVDTNQEEEQKEKD